MWKNFFCKTENKRETAKLNEISADLLPSHIAIIMDGNGRWAQKRGLPRKAGHKKGVDSLREIVKAACSINIKFLTVYAFSTENWKRPTAEVDFLMKLFSVYLDSEVEEMDKNNVRLKFVGCLTELSGELQSQIKKGEKKTADNTGLGLNIAVNYGARDEIVMAARNIAQRVLSRDIEIKDINEQLLDDSLYTAQQPPVDLLIRTSGDMRISNFLLWQCAYAELWFTEKNWPEFMPEDFLRAINDYQKRDRRFGGLDDK
ncbi:isoprenyl transferase [Pectinatus haikarae]|uniref:isoprenyl transferase n=1 Tax=Pectinatus haikarae TaxID=349096 RepID=UPI0018C6CAE5|nr:isoprenyl transferase [Pectinatus haikarae]